MKKFLINCLLFTVFFVGVDYLTNFSKSYDSFRMKEYFDKKISANPDIIMFGSSVNGTFSPKDTDKNSISTMLDAQLKDKSVLNMDHQAYHAEIFYSFVKYFTRKLSSPTILIVPINLRSFAPFWDLNPRFQFARERNILEYYGLHTVPFIGNEPINSQEKLLNSFVMFDNQQLGTVREFIKKRDLKWAFVRNYMQPLKSDHNKLIALKKIAVLAEKENYKLIFYVTPINYEHAYEFKLDSFDEQVKKNIVIIKEALSGKEAIFLDMSYLSGNSDFYYGSRVPNEHLNMIGRSKVATRLAATLEAENL